jgi:hypothetical protein
MLFFRSVHPIHNAVLCVLHQRSVHQSTMLFFAQCINNHNAVLCVHGALHQSTMLFFALSASIHNAVVLCVCTGSVHPVHNAVLCAPVHQSTMLFFALSASIHNAVLCVCRAPHQSTMHCSCAQCINPQCCSLRVHGLSASILPLFFALSASIHNAVLCVCTALRASINAVLCAQCINPMLFFARAQCINTMLFFALSASIHNVSLRAALVLRHQSTTLCSCARCINPQCCSLRVHGAPCMGTHLTLWAEPIFVLPGTSDNGGSMHPMCGMIAFVTITRHRTAPALWHWLPEHTEHFTTCTHCVTIGVFFGWTGIT